MDLRSRSTDIFEPFACFIHPFLHQINISFKYIRHSRYKTRCLGECGQQLPEGDSQGQGGLPGRGDIWVVALELEDAGYSNSFLFTILQQLRTSGMLLERVNIPLLSEWGTAVQFPW